MEGLLHDSFGLLNYILDPPDEIAHEPLGCQCLCATPIQEFPSDVVGLFRAVQKDLSNLRQSDVQSFGSAPHDSSNFTRVSNELFERFSDPNELKFQSPCRFPGCDCRKLQAEESMICCEDRTIEAAYLNHAKPNRFAQTLRIFPTRLLRLFSRFEWLG